MSRKLYALLVGIDKYPPSIPSLRGCVNDINFLNDYLRRGINFELYIEMLKNSEATRESIIRLFRQHLCRAGKDDVVLFHYCGHGSSEESALEFREFFPSGRDETLVCYDSRSPRGLDLADKELAVLLWELARKEPHIAVILDCCHSGSATRGIDDFKLATARQIPARKFSARRSLETYLEGYYKDMAPVVIPQSRHVLMAACDRQQKAWETRGRNGVFTGTLLDVLEKSNGDISYADLFVRCRAAIFKRVRNQTPQFETYQHFMPYVKFLDGQALGTMPRFYVYFEKGNWKMDGGALHGLPPDPQEKIEVALYSHPHPGASGPKKEQGEQPAGNANVISVGAQQSTLELDFQSDTDINYRAELVNLPVTPMPVYLEGDKHEKKRITKAMQGQPGAGFVFTGEPGAARYVLEARNKQYLLYRKENRTLIQGAEGEPGRAIPYMFPVLQQVVRRERTLALQNPHPLINPRDIHLKFFELLDDGTQWAYEGDHVTLDFVKTFDDGEEDWKEIRAKIRVRNCSPQELHFTLVYLSPNFGIYVLRNDPIQPGRDFVTLWGDGPDDAFYLPEDSDEAEDTFMLIVSTERVDDFLLVQENLTPGKIERFPKIRGREDFDTRHISTIEPRKKLKVTNDWFTKTLTVKTVRRLNRVREQDTVLADGQIIIKGHPSFKAELSLTGSRFNPRGTDPDMMLAGFFEDEAHELIRFSSVRGESESMLEFSEIRNEESLKQTPLEICLNLMPEADECILPLTFDGMHFLPIGKPVMEENGNISFKIDSIPAAADATRRSLGKALKMCFLKIVLGKHDVNLLRWVEYKPDGTIARHRDNLENMKDKVAGAKHILLLIHGIIGDTEPIAKGLREVVEENSKSIAEKYDLILTYDYENLNTSIEDTAKQLKQRLEEIGLHEQQPKRITILSHSMGGLVSRWFIEQEGGSKIVKHLIMAGTPNNGSALADITDYRDISITMAALALNFFKSMVASAGALVLALNQSKKITRTLEQMKQDSDFLHFLNRSPDPQVHYTILAGDITGYEVTQDSFFSRLIEKIETGIGKLVYGKQPNDIAVSVNSIKSVTENRTPGPEIFNLSCHHLNYFQAETSLKVLNSVLD